MDMTKFQRAVILAGVVAVFLTGLFPPWVEHSLKGIVFFRGYRVLFSPPYAPHSTIDSPALLTHWLGISLIVFGLYVAFKK